MLFYVTDRAIYTIYMVMAMLSPNALQPAAKLAIWSVSVNWSESGVKLLKRFVLSVASQLIK